MTADQEHDNKASYLKINYSLRPAKSAERKMLCETFRRLSNFTNIENYDYIGFGSNYFSDFTLIHRNLGINSMVSIEKNIRDRARFEFNKPYKCIVMKYGNSNEVLPTLAWENPTILWLDYDGQLTTSVLDDIGIFCTKSRPGSMIVISVNAHSDSPPQNSLAQNSNNNNELNIFRIKKLEENVGKDRLPLGIKGKDLTLKNKSTVLRKIINNVILETISKRNGGGDPANKIEYKQVINFTYQDNAKMLTVGGVIFETSQLSIFKQCGFENLEYFRNDKEEFNIGIPKLTFREIRYLDKKLPPRSVDGEITHLTTEELGELAVIPSQDIEDYIKIYRYFPNFAETEI